MSLGADRANRRMPSTTMLLRAAGLLGSIAAISLLRYATESSLSLAHELSLRLYYVPILVSAYWYGVTGGLAIALISSMAYLHHMSPVTPMFDAGRYAEVAVFQVIAVCVGLLANAQRRVTIGYQRAAATLDSANRELRESHEQIRRIDRLKTLGEVATGLAHEIRHPLASICGALEIIEGRSQPGSPEAEFSRLAMAEVQRLDRLVWEFLRYARPHAPELRSMPLHEVVTQVVMLLHVEAERAKVALEVAQIDTLPDVSIDPLQIEQVLLNVILNAIQATSAGGRIVIREYLDRRDALVDVVDEGAGIATEHLSSIFSPFFTTREKGTGLGLAIAHRIVMAHDGRIEVPHTSAAGTCFRIRLPLGGPSRSALQPLHSEAVV